MKNAHLNTSVDGLKMFTWRNFKKEIENDVKNEKIKELNLKIRNERISILRLIQNADLQRFKTEQGKLTYKCRFHVSIQSPDHLSSYVHRC